MKFAQSLVSFVLATAVVASPTLNVEKRATKVCGLWDSVAAGTLTVYQNLWNTTGYTGSQCSTVTSGTGNPLAWSTSWSWSGGPWQVKSFANAGLTMAPKEISAISTIPTAWKWSYTGSNIVGNVAYDLFSSSNASPGSMADYEVMIWLEAFGGAWPLTTTGLPIATPTLAGVSWKLFSGPNGGTTVYTFIASSPANNFSGDLKTFLTYLVSNHGYPSTQYIHSIQAGTEVFTGSNAILQTTAFSVSIK
ncbi:hypothetical protein NHQ30_001424 [Ciborinia camelliae]|nr:hypothetical protein NHQ30_001424 [Ciborinia camelliae]